MSNSTINNCPNCGASVVFNPEINNLQCKNCKSVYNFTKNNGSIKHSLENFKNTITKPNWKVNETLKCKSCGAQVISVNNTVNNYCPYCGSTTLVENTTSDQIQPDVIIPFEITKEQALKIFKCQFTKKQFLPNDLKREVPKINITGIYIPAFNFDFSTFSTYTGELYTKEKDHEGKEYHRNFKINGNIGMQHNNILIESSNNLINDQLYKIKPYDFKNTYIFDRNFIKGYLIEYSNDNINDCFEKAKRKSKLKIKREILSRYNHDGENYLNISTIYSNEQYSYTILPLYCLDYKYKDKDYISFMNGQTGKSTGRTPRSGIKITLFTLGIIALNLAIFLLIFSIFNKGI